MDRKSTYTFLFVAALLLAIVVGYSSLLRERSRPTVPPDTRLATEVSESLDEERITSVAVGQSDVDQSSKPVGPGGLHKELQVMPKRDRNNLLRLVIRDAGFRCDDVKSSELLYSETGMWQADCGAMLSYSVQIREIGRISIHPIPYGDFSPIERE
jgi:hypothetical protein